MLSTLIPALLPEGEGSKSRRWTPDLRNHRPAINTGDPRTVFTEVSINVVHANGIPSDAAHHKHRTAWHLFLDIASRSQLLDFECANLRPIDRNAVLRKPYKVSVECQNSSGRPGVVPVPAHDRVQRMFAPRAEK